MADYLFRRISTASPPWQWKFPLPPDFIAPPGTGEEVIARRAITDSAPPPQRAANHAYSLDISHHAVDENMPPGRGEQPQRAPAPLPRQAALTTESKLPIDELKQEVFPRFKLLPERAPSAPRAANPAYLPFTAKQAFDEIMPPSRGFQTDFARDKQRAATEAYRSDVAKFVNPDVIPPPQTAGDIGRKRKGKGAKRTPNELSTYTIKWPKEKQPGAPDDRKSQPLDDAENTHVRVTSEASFDLEAEAGSWNVELVPLSIRKRLSMPLPEFEGGARLRVGKQYPARSFEFELSGQGDSFLRDDAEFELVGAAATDLLRRADLESIEWILASGNMDLYVAAQDAKIRRSGSLLEE